MGRCPRTTSARRLFLSLALLTLGFCLSSIADETNLPAKSERFISYTNMVDPEVPWSIHVVKADYTNTNLRFCTTLGGGAVMGTDILSEQIKSLPPEVGLPLAAINGDFYEKSKDYPVRPRDVQIRQGELLTKPAGHTAFWMDAEGRPHMTNIYSRFQVVWPDGKASPMGLNAPRENDEIVLYTAAMGSSTHTKGGVEYVLEPPRGAHWPPLRAGQTYAARVRAVHTTGDHPLADETIVLSVGPSLGSTTPTLRTGASLQLRMETIPGLSGSEVAIGGGPSLVENSKVMEWKGWVHVRHPRTALGWDKKYLYLVQVDGRQLDVSAGMTFAELAEFMLKLGCENAMNLDGGGSSTLWAFGTVRNSPSEGQERPSPNAFVIVRRNQTKDAN